MDGKPLDVDFLAVDGALSVRVGSRMVDLSVEGSPGDLGVVLRGYRGRVRVESERDRATASRKGSKAQGATKVVKSPMPGRIVKVFVKEGDVVEAGQPLLVVEAMKMENEIRAKEAGTIARLHTEAGATVDGNAVLVTFS